MRLSWVGFHEEGLPALEAVLAAGYAVDGVITLPTASAAKRSAVADYHAVCSRAGVPVHEVANINDASSIALLEELAPDVLFVIGWSQILRGPALRSARVGTVGAHASLLPKHRGSAPINWALIRGETRWGNTLMWLSEQVDAGEIIDQSRFDIRPYDTCASLYQQVADSNAEMILRLLPTLVAGERPGCRQQPADGPLLPRRRPADGMIDWTGSSQSVYDFVRALTRPYPGAFGWLDGRRWTVWHSALLPAAVAATRAPGEVLGPVVSPTEMACGQLTACGRGAVVLLELESDDGERLSGRALSDQSWTGQVWTHE